MEHHTLQNSHHLQGLFSCFQKWLSHIESPCCVCRHSPPDGKQPEQRERRPPAHTHTPPPNVTTTTHVCTPYKSYHPQSPYTPAWRGFRALDFSVSSTVHVQALAPKSWGGGGAAPVWASCPGQTSALGTQPVILILVIWYLYHVTRFWSFLGLSLSLSFSRSGALASSLIGRCSWPWEEGKTENKVCLHDASPEGDWIIPLQGSSGKQGKPQASESSFPRNKGAGVFIYPFQVVFG